MTRQETQLLQHGLYRIYWKSGGVSLAAVGSTHNGSRWLAPVNWTSEHKRFADVAATDCWRDVLKVTLIKA